LLYNFIKQEKKSLIPSLFFLRVFNKIIIMQISLLTLLQQVLDYNLLSS
jgi:hypothetical protein